MAVRVLCVCGSMSPGSRTRKLLEIAAGGASAAGAEIRTLDLREMVLPIMLPEDPGQLTHPSVLQVKDTATWADAFLLATPEYHGSMSGVLKNWFDFLYPELAGKVAGIMSQTGGGTGDLSIVAAKTSFQWCHGFTLPFHVGISSRDWEGDRLASPKTEDRLVRLGHDVVRYAAAIRPAWEEALKSGKGPESGFAGFHVK
jgi:FMN reductase